MNQTGSESNLSVTPPAASFGKAGIRAGFLTFLVLHAIPHLLPGIKLSLFSKPAAIASAAFLGTPMTVQEDGIALSHPSLNILVTEACSGYGFFCLASALLVALGAARSTTPSRIKAGISLLGVTYLLTFFSNTSRIVCAAQARLATSEFIPEAYQGAIHQSVGTVIFVTLLALAWTTLSKHYERTETH